MLDERKASILRAVVEEYIQTAQPVGSAHVTRAPGMPTVSSATVRNDMVSLEQDGYLSQPHPSAGRIPTEKGYRYFVDQITPPGRLDQGSAAQVRAFFAARHGEIEQMLHDTSRLLSDLTQYAAVVVAPGNEVATVRSVQLVSLSESVAVLVVVLSNGAVEKHTVSTPAGTSDAQVAAASHELARHLTGATLAEVASVPATGVAEVDTLLRTVADAVATAADHEPEQLYIGGAARMAAAFDAVDTVRKVLGILEQQLLVVTLVRDVLDRGLSVAIGSETGMAPLAECALVVAPYEVDGERAGSIGVLGPTRMNYPQALAAVAVVSHRLGRRLTEG